MDTNRLKLFFLPNKLLQITMKIIQPTCYFNNSKRVIFSNDN